MERDIIQNMISQLGQSQEERLPAELGAGFVEVDEHTPADLLRFVRKLAGRVRYFRGDSAAPAGDWKPFFGFDDQLAERLPAMDDGRVAPHLALLTAFLRLYDRYPRDAINRITGQHLDFFYRRVLRFENQPPVPDRAHVLVELKKGAATTAVLTSHRFSAGKDASGVELLYAPTQDTAVNTSRVGSLRSVFLDVSGRGTVRFAPIANSSDGLGGKLDGAEPKWRAFGYPDLPPAEIGFAVASPVLRMKEGSRKITLTLDVANAGLPRLVREDLLGSFRVFATGEKSWIEPSMSSASLDGGKLTFELLVAETEAAVIDYDAAIHGYAYTAQAPILQLLLKSGAPLGYQDFKSLTLEAARVDVEVAGVTSLSLESDAGTLDPKKAFLPFGPSPVVGSRFMVGYSEALSKKLSELRLDLQWQGAPVFSTHYAGYSRGVGGNADFTASSSFQDGGTWKHAGRGDRLFGDLVAGEATITFTPNGTSSSAPASSGMQVYALSHAGSLWGRNAAVRFALRSPVFRSFVAAAPEPRSGFITLALEQDFRHIDYRKETVANLVQYGKAGSGTPLVLNEPYTPTLRTISLAYKAHSEEVDIASPKLEDFAQTDVQFFHAGCFGQMREHGHQRQQFDYVLDKHVTLLPRYEDEGELLIGMDGLAAGDGVSLLFQLAEGSANPDLTRQPVRWSVLADNYWKALSGQELVRDTTNGLLRSGVVGIVVPREATTQNTILPAGPVWLKAAIARGSDAVCQAIDVVANAVELRLAVDPGAHSAHLLAPLPAGKISRLKTPIAAAKAVIQPYASFGGAPAESETARNTRAAERLRHRARAISPWDYERIVLGAFPSVRRVKCIPHAKDGAWLSPGCVLVAVVPDLRNRNAVDPLQPKVDADTLDRIRTHLQARAGMQAQIAVKNPRYQKIQLDFKVKFETGREFNYYSAQIKKDLIRFLSPWAYEAERTIAFGGRVYKSVVLDFIEKLEYVDYVTDFKMYSYSGTANDFHDLDDARAQTPDAVLVSEQTHLVAEAA